MRFILLLAEPAFAETCYANFCATNRVVKGTGGWNIHVTLRPRVTKDAVFNVIIQGGAQQEMSGNTGTVVFDFTAPEEGPATYSAQFCYRPGSHSFCNAWAVVHPALPYPCPDPYVWRDAFEDDYKCVVLKDRYRNPDGTCKTGYVWRDSFDGDNVCVTPKERDAAKAAAKAKAGQVLPGSTTGKGGGFIQMFPTLAIREDLDIHAEPGPDTKVIGIARGNTAAALIDKNADGWCKFASLPADPGPPKFALAVPVRVSAVVSTFHRSHVACLTPI